MFQAFESSTAVVKVVFYRARSICIVTVRALGSCSFVGIDRRLPRGYYPCFVLFFTLSRPVTSYLPCLRIQSFHKFGKSSFSSCSRTKYSHSISITWIFISAHPRAFTCLLPPLLFLTTSIPVKAYLRRGSGFRCFPRIHAPLPGFYQS